MSYLKQFSTVNVMLCAFFVEWQWIDTIYLQFYDLNVFML